ncbi:glycoside hydrolase family 105 protein [Cristinia sonorae]|uniref:Glycoside hydrolase family 105 protein n=1 Tax=Cristinia sonorae TaxID=1940300 RepID=A0A8K0XTY1_9AGAR|nr:glycoside hydrolase family 105 protein [Cristinia sonorae]
MSTVQEKTALLQTIRSLIHCLVEIKDETGQFLMPLADGRVIDTKGWNDWEWTHGVGLYGLLKFHEATGDEYPLEVALKWFKERFEVGTTKNVNTMSPLLTAAYLHESRHANYLPHLESWADWVMYEMPRTAEGGLQHMTYLEDHYQQLWDDTLMMSVLPLAKIGLVLNKPEYVEDAKRQFMLHAKYLADPVTGLWFHGWTFEGRNHFGRALWGRGNCWITVSIPDFIDLLQLGPQDGLRLFLVTTLTAQIDALVKYQDEKTGLWHTILDDPTSYLEASATAGFAYGILKSLRLRLIPRKDEYVKAAKKAVQGVLANISKDGELQQVSFGTPVFKTIEEYKQIPLTSMPYGQSLALLALTEYYRSLL